MIRRAAIVVLRAPDFEMRQWALLLEYCRDHHLQPTALIRRDPLAALALCRAGHVDCVVAPCTDVQGILRNADVPVLFVRPPGHLRTTRPTMNSSGPLILQMLVRGGTVEQVAQLLDLPLEDVRAVAMTQPWFRQQQTASASAEVPEQRRPVLRQQPADHPWRADLPKVAP